MKSVANRIVSGIAVLFATMAAQAIPVSGQGTWETTLLARDLNTDGVVDAWYDTVLDISWMADANYAGTNGVNLNRRGAGILYTDTWNTYLAGLDFHGTTGWRLTTGGQEDHPSCGRSGGYVASGIGCSFATTPGDSELAHLYYVTLGNSTGSLTNTGNFLNIVTSGSIRMGSNYGGQYKNPAHGDLPMSFNFGVGHKNIYREDDGYYGWAVRDGDVAPVPEPETWALMLAGLAGLGAWARRSQRSRA
jgi:hypothetical protein